MTCASNWIRCFMVTPLGYKNTVRMPYFASNCNKQSRILMTLRGGNLRCPETGFMYGCNAGTHQSSIAYAQTVTTAVHERAYADSQKKRPRDFPLLSIECPRFPNSCRFSLLERATVCPCEGLPNIS